MQEICRRCRSNSWVGKIPWRREWQLTPVFLPGKSHGQRSLVGYSPWGRRGSDMTEQLNNNPVQAAEQLNNNPVQAAHHEDLGCHSGPCSADASPTDRETETVACDLPDPCPQDPSQRMTLLSILNPLPKCECLR